MIRVGVVGLGMMGLTHLDVYRRRDDVVIGAISDADPSRLAGEVRAAGNIEGQARGGVAALIDVRRYARADELIDDDDLDLVDICLPTDLHVEHARAALRAGRHVIVEKPLARTAAEAAPLVADAARAPGLLFVAQCMRYWPGWSWLKETVDAAPYGRALAATFRRIAPHPGGAFYGDGDRSGGAALDLHIHDTDFVAWCFGCLRTVTSFGYATVTDRPDHIVTRYGYDDGPLVVAEGSWALAPGVPFSMHFTVNFERATAIFDSTRTEPLMLYRPAAEPQAVAVGDRMGYEVELDDFLRCIREGVAPTIVTPEAAMESVAIVEAEVRSVETGRPVVLG